MLTVHRGISRANRYESFSPTKSWGQGRIVTLAERREQPAEILVESGIPLERDCAVMPAIASNP